MPAPFPRRPSAPPLGLLDADGQEITPMTASAARDRGARRFPAHPDTRPGDTAWWHGPERYSREEPCVTFDRARDRRDARDRRRRFLAGELRGLEAEVRCSCPAGCEYAVPLDEDLGHAATCTCRCDVG
jgi:hypothetical protein